MQLQGPGNSVGCERQTWDHNPQVEAAERASERLVGRMENKAGSCEVYSHQVGLWACVKLGLLGESQTFPWETLPEG